MSSTRTHTGFPSPADDYLEGVIDLNKEVIKNPSSTFFAKVKGVSFLKSLIFPEDILVIDRSLPLRNNNFVVCYLDGEFTLRRVKKDKVGIWLQPDEEFEREVLVMSDNDFVVWGVVTYIFKKVH